MAEGRRASAGGESRSDAELPRTGAVPDQRRLGPYREAPRHGPVLLCFSGGSALRPLSEHLIRYTHNSVHLITPFDSGGSSAALRRAFRMPAVGDLRNRILALSDASVPGSRETCRLFAARLPLDEPPAHLADRVRALVDGRAPSVRDLPGAVRQTVRDHLGAFEERMPAAFDLRGAAIGNLFLAGGYLLNGRRLGPALSLLSELVAARGTVRPVVDRSLHLVAELEDGSRVVGQDRITRDGGRLGDRRVVRIFLSRSRAEPRPERVMIDGATRASIERADLICFPIGSFYTSVIAALLPHGVADAVADSSAPKVYVPNPPGTDPEEGGLSLTEKVVRLRETLEAGGGGGTSGKTVLDRVLLDDRLGRCPPVSELRALEAIGVEPVRAPLSAPDSGGRYDGVRLVEALLSLA